MASRPCRGLPPVIASNEGGSPAQAVSATSVESANWRARMRSAFARHADADARRCTAHQPARTDHQSANQIREPTGHQHHEPAELLILERIEAERTRRL